jgi:hypothetical protein
MGERIASHQRLVHTSSAFSKHGEKMASCAATLKEAEEEHHQYVAALIIVNSKVLSMHSSEGARNQKAIRRSNV